MGRPCRNYDRVMSRSSRGTATNLLRTAWDLCAADVAFLALQGPDGALQLSSTFPEHASWTPEILCRMARGVWADPGLQGGKVLVSPAHMDADAGDGELEDGGEDQWSPRYEPGAPPEPSSVHPVTIAAAAMIDRGISDEVQGLLCVVNPATGYFDEDQLEALNGLAMRLSAHMKAHEEVFGSGPASPPVPGAPPRPGLPLLDRRHPAAEEAARQILASQGAPLDARVAGAPATAEDERTPAEPAGASAGAARTGTPAGQAAAGIQPETATRGAITALLDPDVVTGLPTAASFLARLGYAMGTIERTGNELAVLLVEITRTSGETHGAASADALVRDAAAHLEGCVRHDDGIARVAPGALAVLCTFSPGMDRATVLQARLIATLRDVLSETAPDATVRSSLARATPQALRSPEGLLREAAENLGG